MSVVKNVKPKHEKARLHLLGNCTAVTNNMTNVLVEESMDGKDNSKVSLGFYGEIVSTILDTGVYTAKLQSYIGIRSLLVGLSYSTTERLFFCLGRTVLHKMLQSAL